MNPVLQVKRNDAGAARAPTVMAIAIVMVALCLGESGCRRQPGGEAAATAPPAEVEFIEARQSDVPVTNEWIGTTEGSASVEIRARVTGYLQTQAYNDGALVNAGDVLFQIDPRPFDAALAQAKAELAKAQADQAKSQTDVDRLTPLVPHAVSQQELDDAKAANAANLALIEAAKASIEQAQLNLEFTRIVAPIGGIVGIAQAQVGDLVGPSSGTLASISTLNPIKVVFPISEQEYIRAAERGVKQLEQPVEQRPDIQLYLADGSEFPHPGKFVNIDLQVAVSTGTIKVVALFPNPGNILRPGQYARVKAVVSEEKGVILVPQRAVVELQGAFQVAVIDSENKARIRAVEAGERTGSEWIIRKGLQPGDRVIVSGIQKVRDGAPVSAKPYQPAALPATAPARAQ